MKWHLPLLADLFLIGLVGWGISACGMPGLAWWVVLAAWLVAWRLERRDPSLFGARALLGLGLLLALSARATAWANNGVAWGLGLAVIAASLRLAIRGPHHRVNLPWIEKVFYILGALLWILGAYANDSAKALIFTAPALALAARSIWYRSAAGRPLWVHTLRTEIHIDAAPAKVWKILTDTGHYGQWNPFIQELEGQLEVGAKLKARLGLGETPMTFKPKVLAFKKEEELRWMGHFIVPGVFDGEHFFQLHEKDGGTRFVHGEHFSGLIAPLLTIYEQTLHGFKSMNQALKKRAEA